MNSTGNQTAPLTPGMICSNEAEFFSMATVQFLSFLANWVAVIATSKLPGLEENKYHLVVRTPTGCQRPPDPNHNASILYHLLCNLFVDWRRDFCSVTVFISATFLSWSFVIVFIMCLLRFLAVTRPLYYRNEVTYARVRKTDSRSVMALRSPYSSCYGPQKVSFVQ